MRDVSDADRVEGLWDDRTPEQRRGDDEMNRWLRARRRAGAIEIDSRVAVDGEMADGDPNAGLRGGTERTR